MDRRIGSLSPLESILEKMKKWDRSPLGKFQIRSHHWLIRLESHPFIQAYGTIFRGSRLSMGTRSEPAINFDSVFFFSLIFHLLILILMSWATLSSSPVNQPGPIHVRFIEIAKQVQRQPTQRSKTAKRRPKRPRPKKAPPLPAPKVVASLRENPVSFTPQSVESMIRLPTQQSSAAQAPQLQVETAPVSTVDMVSINELKLPKGLLQGEETPAMEGRTSAIQSPDFAPYLEMIKRRVESVWSYPEGVAGIQKVNLLFVLDRGGKLVRAVVLDSTNPELDPGVLEAVKKASPFPPIPKSLKDLAGWPLRIRFTIDFGIKVAK